MPEHVNWELVPGVRALWNLLNVIRDAGAELNLQFVHRGAWMGFQDSEGRFHVGVHLKEPAVLEFCFSAPNLEMPLGDEFGAADTVGFARSLDLSSEDVHFFARSTESQLECIKGFLESCISQMQGELDDVPPEPPPAPEVHGDQEWPEQPPQADPGVGQPEPLPNTDQQLFERLHRRRTEIASERGVAPFIIALNDTLRGISHQRPTTSPQLLQVHGIGETALANYGADWIAVVRDFVHEEAADQITDLERSFWLIVGKAVLLPYQEVQGVFQWANEDTPNGPASLRICFWNIVKTEAFRRQDNGSTRRVTDAATAAFEAAEQIEDAIGGNLFDIYVILKNVEDDGGIDVDSLREIPAESACEKILEYLFLKGIQTDPGSTDGTFLQTVTLADLLAGRDQEDPFV